MRIILKRRKINSVVLKPFRRWSIFVCFVICMTLLGVVKYLQVPLKSLDKERPPHFVRHRDANIIEYLHRLHNVKTGQGIASEDSEKAQPLDLLEVTFNKADSNRDGFLTMDELTKWINLKTQEHIHEAILENYKLFTSIDVRPKDGLISWKEYHNYFLEKNGFNKTYIQKHAENHKGLSRTMKETIMRDRAGWSECAKTDPDHLTLDEFLSFRHPESSYSSILSLVDEIYRKFDRDGDESLTEDEFSLLQTEEEYEKSDLMNQEEMERRKEFRELVDVNKDGKATRKEMLNYVDPKNPRHAREEAESLFELGDVDRDKRLSLLEVLNKMDLFLASKMVDTARSFHEEF